MGFLKFPKFRVQCETNERGYVKYKVQRCDRVGFWWEWENLRIYSSSLEQGEKHMQSTKALAIAKMEELILMEASRQAFYKATPRTFHIYPKKEKPNGE